MAVDQLCLAGLFSDHAVLQRNIMVPVWGWATPFAPVTATLGAAAAQTLAGEDGKFLLRLPALPAGGPFELTVEAPAQKQKIVRTDIWVGEVWLASGQSNMEWSLAQTQQENDPALRTGEVRMAYIPHNAFAGRQSRIETKWEVGDTEQNLTSFSAVGYFFARRLSEELGVKVGIINSSWGGTIVEAWTSRESLARNPDTAPWLARYENTTHGLPYWKERNQPAESAKASPYPADPGNTALAKGWASAELDDTAWPEMKIPSPWTAQGHKKSGVFWFRKTVEIPADWAGKELTLNIGAVDKQDITYFNGEQVGALGSGFEECFWNRPRVYTVPGHLVKAGKNVITVRAYSFAYDGGLIGPANRMKLVLEGCEQSVSLPGTWKYQIEHDFGLVSVSNAMQTPPGPGMPNSPGILFDNMIAPLLPYAIRGAIWYQGESNANDSFAVNCDRYCEAIRTLMRDWHFYWGQGDFPFLQVQLANYMMLQAYQDGSLWARLRDSQLRSLAEPNAGMAVIIDAGEGDNIHPADKVTVGRRLAQWALAKTYGKHFIASGPLYAGMTIEGDAIRVRFDYVGSGLVAKDGGALKTFVIAGQDKVFHEATAQIDGGYVVVRSPDVPAPLAVRYAWADNPEGCNLYNAAGLPASPFRTDGW